MEEKSGGFPDDGALSGHAGAVTVSTAAKLCLRFTGDYIRRKTLELVGLRLTPVQHVYWKAVQRRMVLGQLQELMESREGAGGGVNQLPPIPHELLRALTKSDKAMCTGVSKVCYGMEVALPREEQSNLRPAAPDDIPLERLGHSESLLEEESVDYGEDSPDTGRLPKLPKIGYYTQAQTGRLPRELVSDGLEELDQQGSFWSRAIAFFKFLRMLVLEFQSTNQRRVANQPTRERMILADDDNVGSGDDEIDGAGNPSHMYIFPASSTCTGQIGADPEKNDVCELSFFGVEDEASTWRKPLIGAAKGIPPYRRGRMASRSLMGREELDKQESTSAGRAVRTDSIDSYRTSKERRRAKRKERKAEWEGRKKEWRPIWQNINNFIPLRVTNFKYKYMSTNHQIRVKEMRDKAARWPLFTWWLSFVQIVVTISSLGIYGVAPVGYGEFSERSLVQLSDLSVQVVERNITPNFWVGPSQENLVLLGANYGPCMRRDKRLLEGIEKDVMEEASSGCCVRRDQSGCVQTVEDDCPVMEQFADFISTDPAVDPEGPYSTGAVCGTSPLTCVDPDPTRDSRWQSVNITGWPICNEMHAVSGNDTEHLTCDLTGRPCCVGIQAICLITSQEHCDYLGGTLHPDAFLCSQVDCLSAVCGLLPFAENGSPDQIYRLFLSFFIHAGIIHLVITLLFNFYILRDLEKYLGWQSTSLLFIGSGVGGNLFSAIFVPYSPEVGPAAGEFGVITFFFVFIFYHWSLLANGCIELLKYFGLVIIPLFFIGLFPYVDNFARIGGCIFGLFLSFVVVHYIPDHQSVVEFRRYAHLLRYPKSEYRPPIKSSTPVVKYALLLTGAAGGISLAIIALVWFINVQETLDGFQYFNCILGLVPGGEVFCLDYGQNIRSRDIL